ncbi:MAG: NifU family protein [Erysipelotrichaceae bacterium]|jgi:Fe-S cluster biogenesis protein NfuA|nr:NifU family protein [Erysipelotrichaceae bacterium]
MENESIIKQIEKSLDKIRFFIQRDGGDVMFDHYEDGIVYVRFSGACVDCMMQDSTINEGIKIILMEEVPGIIDVRTV